MASQESKDQQSIPTQDELNPEKQVPGGDGKEATSLAATIADSQGYDPDKAEGIAASMLDNAGVTYAASNGAPQAGSAGQIGAPEKIDNSDQYLDDATLEDAMATGVGIGNTDVTTREVEDPELVEKRMEGLLSEDSSYIRNARMRAMEESNARGQFGSSFKAGAAERSAIEAALPIATADAQAYRDAASQNMNALNSMALAHLQRATAIDTAVLNSNTQRGMANLDAGVRTSIANLDAMTKIDISNLDAHTRTNLANLQAQTQVHVQKMVNDNARYLQGQQLTHETGLEQLRQQGRVEIATMDAELQTRLTEYIEDGKINLANMDHESKLAVNEKIAQYDMEKQAEGHRLERQTEHANLVMQAQMNYTQYVSSYSGVDMDAAAAKRLQDDATNVLENTLRMINSQYPEFTPITVDG